MSLKRIVGEWTVKQTNKSIRSEKSWRGFTYLCIGLKHDFTSIIRLPDMIRSNEMWNRIDEYDVTNTLFILWKYFVK